MKQQALRSVLRFRDIHSGAEAHVHMTECSVPDLALQQQAIIEEDYGCMIAMINGETKRVPLAEVSGKLKTVDPDCQMIQEAKRIGISFGD